MSRIGRPRRHYSEQREYARLAGELDALSQDIADARQDAARATKGRLDFHARRDAASAPHGEPVTLADGARILVRPIEPEDRHELDLGFRRLGSLSRYERFCGPIDGLASEQLAFLSAVDHHDHEALVAFSADSGEGVGVARYIRDSDDPGQAIFACTVADAWQERGVGSVLAEHLARRAKAAGIERFRAVVLAGNRRGRRLLAHIADEIDESRNAGLVEIRARLRDG